MGCSKNSCGCGPREADDFDSCREGISEADLDRFGSDDVPCPSCGTSVYHDAVLCQACGHAMGDPADAKSATGARPWLALAAAAALIAVIAVWVF